MKEAWRNEQEGRDPLQGPKHRPRLSGVALLLFAKAPVAGFSKTRLIPALGPEGAAGVAARLLEHAVTEALRSELEEVELCVAPAPEATVWKPFQERDWAVCWTAQGEGDLGERLARAARRRLSHGSQVLFAGTDCPFLTAGVYQAAARELSSRDAVLIPATDGGYVLLGLRRFSPTIFQQIPWSSNRVAEQTRRRLKELGWSFSELEPLPDVDEPKDLELLRSLGWL